MEKEKELGGNQYQKRGDEKAEQKAKKRERKRSRTSSCVRKTPTEGRSQINGKRELRKFILSILPKLTWFDMV